MRHKPGTPKPLADQVAKDIRRRTRKHHSAEEKICIVTSLTYNWWNAYLEAGKKCLAGNTARQATSPKIKDLRTEAAALKEVVADLTLENRLLKKA